MSNPQSVQDFIRRWQASGAAERANFPQFAVELCDVLDVPHPDPTRPDDEQNAYVFERSVPLPHSSTGRIDLYKRGCIVLEAKQGTAVFKGARGARVTELLETLVSLGQAREVEGERFVAQ